MPITEAIKSLNDLSDLDDASLMSPYPLVCSSRDDELEPFSCMVCTATYLEDISVAHCRLIDTERDIDRGEGNEMTL